MQPDIPPEGKATKQKLFYLYSNMKFNTISNMFSSHQVCAHKKSQSWTGFGGFTALIDCFAVEVSFPDLFAAGAV